MKWIFRRARCLPVAVLCLLATPALAEVAGRATVIDGDTLEIRGQRIRLHGIDAPETGQTCRRDGAPWDCGRAAAELLRELTAGKRIVCAERATGGGGLLEAKCKAAWLDLGAEMVTRGMALPEPRNPSDYLRNYQEARGRGNGIFAGAFVEPKDWRNGKRLAIEGGNDGSPGGGCNVWTLRHRSLLERRAKQDGPAPSR